MGISLCSVSGTHFLPYVKFIGRSGLNLPFAVVTDSDPDKEGNLIGVSRLRKLLKHLRPDELYEDEDDDDDTIALAKQAGLFITVHTFEVALFSCGRYHSYNQTIGELSENKAAHARAQAWATDPKQLDTSKLLADVSEVGKGRFAQRWASNIDRRGGTAWPLSVREAIEHVARLLR